MPSGGAEIIISEDPPARAQAIADGDTDKIAQLDRALAFGQHYQPLDPSPSTEATLVALGNLLQPGTPKEIAAKNDLLIGYPP